MIVYLHAALDERLSSGRVVTNEDVERSVIDGAVLRLRLKLMTVLAVIGSLGPILRSSETKAAEVADGFLG
jgi:copper/silver efflux system protein